MIPLGVLAAADRSGGGGAADPLAASIYAKLSHWLPYDSDKEDAHGGAIVSGTFEAATGKVGGAASAPVNAISKASPATSGQSSFGAWVYIGSETTRVIQGYMDGSSAGESFYTAYIAGGQFAVGARTMGGANPVVLDAPSSRELNTWYLVGGTYDDGELALVVNGDVVGSVAVTGDLKVTASFVVGSLYSGGLPGRGDEAFCCHGSVLSPEEWAYLYNGGAGRGYQALKAAAGF